MMEPFRRNNDNGVISYDVLNSKKAHYYRVEMLNGIAISCECRNGQIGNRNQTCFHKRTAEREETKLQASVKELEKPVDIAEKRRLAPLHSAVNSFNLLR